MKLPLQHEKAMYDQNRGTIGMALLRITLLVSAGLHADAILASQSVGFDNVDLKRHPPDVDSSSRPALNNGTFRAENVTLKVLLGVAYGVSTTRISGPDWLDSEKFDIAAKAPEGTANRDVKPMLQSLLVERFKIAFHSETQRIAAFDLVLLTGGIRHSPIDQETNPAQQASSAGVMVSGTGTMANIAELLASVLGKPVIDRTELKGNYVFALKFSPPSTDTSATTSGQVLPDVFKAVQEQMGLKLDLRTQPMQMMVIDQAKSLPFDK